MLAVFLEWIIKLDWYDIYQCDIEPRYQAFSQKRLSMRFLH